MTYCIFMDLLGDLLKHSGLKSRILGHRSFSGSVSLQFPCSKSIGFHVVTHGQAFIHRGVKDKPMILKKGDIALMARGCDHVVSTEEKLTGRLTPLSGFDRSFRENAKTKLTLVSGAYQLWNSPVHPFFNEMPDWFVLKSEDIESYDSLQTMINLLAEEVAKPDLGSDRAVQGILDVMFSFIMRRIVLKTSQRTQTWSHALQDLEIKQALELMHADVAKAWTLETLAKQVGLSRAGFALKFKRTMGDTPLHYLTTLRIQQAMELLSNSEDNIERVALQVGYQDAFSFSKAFKKLTGLPPRDFRANNIKERQVGWRI